MKSMISIPLFIYQGFVFLSLVLGGCLNHQPYDKLLSLRSLVCTLNSRCLFLGSCGKMNDSKFLKFAVILCIYQKLDTSCTPTAQAFENANSICLVMFCGF